MGEIEGSYRALQTPGTRLGAQFNAGISTLEPGLSLSTAPGGGSGVRGQGRGIQIRVQGLDDTQEFYDLESKVDGQTLQCEVFRRCNIIESDYFGLEFQNMQMNWVWLELNKLLVKQVRRPGNTLFRLSVKFFPPDPGQLHEEYTRYLFSLQVKRDLTDGRLSCTENTGALLASHLLQSEIGDYDDMADRDFLLVNKLLPYQDKVQDRIIELHSRHLGQTPAESDFQVLEIARKLEMYGVRLHSAADREGTRISLAVAHLGLQVFQGNTKINTFNWSKIRKLSFKRKRFLIKLHPEVHGPHQDTLEFMMAGRDQCKIFWKSCVEHHSFFRLLDQPQPKSRAIFFSRGSSFRYSGRTQKQLVEYVRESGARRTPYQRRNSKVRMSARSLASDGPKQSLSFNDSLRLPGSPASGSVSFHSMHLSSSPARFQPQHSPGPSLGASPSLGPGPGQPPAPQQPQPPQSARPSSPPKEDRVKAPPPPPAVQGAPSSRAAALPHPSVCVESSPSPTLPPHSTEHTEQGGRRGVGFYVGGGGGGGESKGFLTSEAFEAEILRAGQKPVFCLPPPPLQVSEEFIDDDPTEMSFYGGSAEAYACGLLGTGAPGFVYGDPRGRSPEDLADPFPCCPRSETSSLANNRSSCSSLDQLGLSSAGESYGGGPDASCLLPGSDAPSEASSMVNFPACSVRSDGSAALQFSDLLEQLEQLSYPPTATEASADSDSDWGSDGGLPPEQNLFYSNPLGGAEGFLLQCHNLQALALGDPPTSPHGDM